MATRWTSTDAPRGGDYDSRWEALAASGQEVHGETNFVEARIAPGASVLDGGCGTGRVAIELARRGFDVVGLDADAPMLAAARAKAPELSWIEADLATFTVGRTFDAVVLAGNVMIFVAPGTEGTVLERIGQHLGSGGLLIAGFQLRADRLPLTRYDELAQAAGFDLDNRFATWDGDPFSGGDYAVSVHRLR